MSFIALIVKNLVHQKVRTALTVLGISIGTTTVVALGVVVGGLKETTNQILHAYDSDFLVARKGAPDLSLSTVTEKEADAPAARPDISRTIRALFDISQVGANPYFATLGVRAEDVAQSPPTLLAGSCQVRARTSPARRTRPSPRRRCGRRR